MLFLPLGNPDSMETRAVEDSIPTMTRLFDQLGLDSEPTSIQAFIAAHKPLAATTKLADAPFWSPSQAEFLRGEMEEDSDWAIVIERLNAALRAAS
jgi:hypothetical protein